ncbi:NADPH-dependent FMN reductase [Embleya sp. NPDC050154]|uniref:NADPH-dependent FMN reductase n=1 Tax=Embleya sp. NPDC050154 TaxID=3363988 RepID=UPI00378E3E23
MLNVAIVVGSTRPGNRAGAVARWIHETASRRADATWEIVDLGDFELPLLDEPIPAAVDDYRHEHTKRWAAKMATFDAYVFVTPEYNHSTSGALKNAIDFLYAEWVNKAAGFVSYGYDGGTRAVEHLRLVLGGLQVADVAAQVALTIHGDYVDETELRPREHQYAAAGSMLDQVVAWGAALRSLRLGDEL